MQNTRQHFATRPGSVATETDLGTIIVTPHRLSRTFDAQVYWGDFMVAEVGCLMTRSAATASAKGFARRIQKSADKAAAKRAAR